MPVLPEDPTHLFRPISIGALYPGIERGLAGTILAARALDGTAFPVCTSLVVAGGGYTTDVLDVPADNVIAQLEHLFGTAHPNAALLGALGNEHTIRGVFRVLSGNLSGPLVLNLTLSGPSGEDIAGHGAREALLEHLARPDLVTVSRQDAELLASIEIRTLDDAQVAIQRLHKLGARRVLLRCGILPARFFDENGGTNQPDYWADLFFDGEDIGLFEAPDIPADEVHGSAEALGMAVLRGLWAGNPLHEALQYAKSYVTEALFRRSNTPLKNVPHYFWIKEAAQK